MCPYFTLILCGALFAIYGKKRVNFSQGIGYLVKDFSQGEGAWNEIWIAV